MRKRRQALGEGADARRWGRQGLMQHPASDRKVDPEDGPSRQASAADSALDARQADRAALHASRVRPTGLPEGEVVGLLEAELVHAGARRADRTSEGGRAARLPAAGQADASAGE